jgi:hypothetical protein
MEERVMKMKSLVHMAVVLIAFSAVPVLAAEKPNISFI